MIENRLFLKVYKEHKDLVYNLCLNYLQNKQDAEEVFQDVFLSIHKNIEKFQGKAQVKTWIYRIAVHKSLDFIKAKKTKKRFAFFNTKRLEDVNLHSKIDHPGILLENKEATHRIFNALSTLPHQQKTALILKSMEQLSQKEIAKVMKTSEKAVESLLSRARKKLKEKLNETKDD